MTFKVQLMWMLGVAGVFYAWAPAYGQQFSKEYVRLGRQVVAIENAGPPTIVSVIASPTSGTSSTFTIQASDIYLPNNPGYQNIAEVDLLINFWLNGPNACYVVAYVGGGTTGLKLMNTAGTGWSAGVPFASASTLSNSDCNFTFASTSGSGNNLTVTYRINFTPNSQFAGTQVLWAAAIDTQGRSSGWQPSGTFPVSGPAVSNPVVSGMSPATGAGWNQPFALTFNDTNNWPSGSPGSLVDVLMNNSLNGIGACYVAFVRPNLLYLVDDAGDSAGPFAGSLTLPSSGTISNSQCTISASYAVSGTILTLTLNMSFTGPFGGSRIFYAAAVSNSVSSGWQAIGSWTVP